MSNIVVDVLYLFGTDYVYFKTIFDCNSIRMVSILPKCYPFFLPPYVEKSKGIIGNIIPI